MPVAATAVNAATDIGDQPAPRRGRGPWRKAMPRRDRQRHFARLLLRVFGTGYSDPLFERPDLVEDDYYRFLKQPRG